MRRRRWCNAHTRCLWRHRFLAFPQSWRSYAHALSFCESRDHRIARASGFLSFFQWTERTWLAEGGHGNPEQASWYEQAVRAIIMTERVGVHSSAGFPNCPKGW